MCSSPMHKWNELEVLLVSSQKSQNMMFPKGGWELDETMEEAARRETLEEAGVIGKVQELLGTWPFKSKSQDMFHDGYMFPLLVEKQLDQWSEKDFRQRKWVKVSEFMELCPYLWMKEALEKLENRLCSFDSNALSKNSTRVKRKQDPRETNVQYLKHFCTSGGIWAIDEECN
ncbi:hypothetical protein V2J09_011297 [Rumex salicifolius]